MQEVVAGDPEATGDADPEVGRRGRCWSRLVRWLSAANLLFVIGFVLLVAWVSERWWPGVLATYAPRLPVLIPALLLLPVALVLDRWISVALNAAAVALVLVVAMEFNFAFGPGNDGRSAGEPYRVATCNVMHFHGDFDTTLKELAAADLDLLVLQEAYHFGEDRLLTAFPGWHITNIGEYCVASRFPVQEAGRLQTEEFDRLSAAAFEVHHPEGPVVVINLHPQSAQYGVNDLFSREGGGRSFAAGVEKLNEHQKKRHAVNRQLREFVEQSRREGAVIVAGDFNTPVSSSLFREVWADFTDAFSVAGFGYGYTAPCNGPGPVPEGWPWIRIDHVLVDDAWQVAAATVGESNGSDHRPVIVELRRVAPADSASGVDGADE